MGFLKVALITEFIDENGGGPGVRLRKSTPEEGLTGPRSIRLILRRCANFETDPFALGEVSGTLRDNKVIDG